MNKTTEAVLTTQTALDLIAHERAPRYAGRSVNRRVVCEDGYCLSVQASDMHYAHDSHPSGEAAYWRGVDAEVAHPFTSFELGNPSNRFDDEPLLRGPHEEDGASGVCPWVPRDVVAAVLDAHGGAVTWEAAR